MEEIHDHWDDIIAQPLVMEPYEMEAQNSTCLRELNHWLYELLEKDWFMLRSSHGIKVTGSDICPASILYPDYTAIELQGILPEAKEVKAILPVLATGYIMNRRSDSTSRDLYSPHYTANLFISLYNAKDSDTVLHYKAVSETLFRVKSWDKMFSAIEYGQITNARMKKIPVLLWNAEYILIPYIQNAEIL